MSEGAQAETLLTGRDEQLQGRLWWSSDKVPRGLVLVVHGLGDHSGRFQFFAEKLNTADFAVFAFDLPGHGLSPGRRGHFRKYQEVLLEIEAARVTAANRLPGVAQFMLGHSMGGNLAINYVLRYADLHSFAGKLAGLVLAAPMLLPPNPPKRSQIFAAWLTGFLLPWFKVSRGFESPPQENGQATGDAAADAGSDDPLLHGDITIYVATQLLAQGRWALDHARNVDLPTLVIDCEDDEMIDRAASRNVVIRMGNNATHRTFPIGGHNLLHPPAQSAAIETIIQWLHTQVDGDW